jgi:hypothetical protein
MTTCYATSVDGLDWQFVGAALVPVADTWAARGTRITDVHHVAGQWWALFDGRRSAEENWRERSGLAVGDSPERFTEVAGPMPERVGPALRYASVLRVNGGWRAYVEATGSEGSHDLRTVYVPRPSGASQSE